MKKFIERIEEILNNSHFIERTQIAVYADDTYLIHVYGYKEHSFSIKITTFPESIICFFGYNEEVILPLNDNSFEHIAHLINKAINFGNRIIKTISGETVGIYELIADDYLTPDAVINLYRMDCESYKKKPCPCTLVCSDFCGKNTFEVCYE